MFTEPDLDKPLETHSPTRASLVARPKRTDGPSPRAGRTDDEASLEFLRFALHDLQTSVAVLDIGTTLLAGDLATADADALATLRDIRRAASRIQQYIDHLVTSERLSSGRFTLHREPVDLVPLLAAVAEDHAQYARAFSASVQLDCPASPIGLRADEVILRRVFQNLLENSLRHAGTGGRILIQARATSGVEVCVCNDGPPVPEAVRKNLLGKLSDEEGLAGLGLRFCKQAVAAHRGTITIEPHPDWPTCFVIRLPSAAI